MSRTPADRLELNGLLACVADGSVTATQSQRLNELMRDDPEARAAYIDYIMTDAMLRWTDNAGAPAGPMPIASEPASHRPASHRPASNAGWRIAAAVVFALAIVGIVIGAIVMQPEPTATAPVLGPKVAVLADVEGVVLVEATGESAESGAELRAGWLNVPSGTAEIVFDSGAAVRLAGPARLRLDSTNAAEFTRGRLVAEVPPSAVGFTVKTGGWSVVDLGTSFGVSIGPRGEASVHVFTGRVRLDGYGGSHDIVAGSAMRTAGGEVASIALDRPAFAGLRLSIADATEPEHVPAEASLALWLTADRGIDLDPQGHVSAWRDARNERAGRATQDMAAYRPVWVSDGIEDRPAVRFDGGQLLTLPTAQAMEIAGGDYEVFIVAHTRDPRVQFLLAGGEGGNEWYEMHVNGDAGLRFIPAPWAASPGVEPTAVYADLARNGETIGRAFVYHGRVMGDTATVSVNGADSEDTVKMPGNGRWGGDLQLGMRGNGGYGLRGDIAEVLIYSAALSVEDRAAVVEYLNKRYGVIEPGKPAVDASESLENHGIAQPFRGVEP